MELNIPYTIIFLGSCCGPEVHFHVKMILLDFKKHQDHRSCYLNLNPAYHNLKHHAQMIKFCSFYILLFQNDPFQLFSGSDVKILYPLI